MLDDAPRYDVFISYAREDDKRLGHASKLDTDLTAQGFRVWRDTRGIDPARDFTAEIERAIEASDFVVACITPDVRRDESFVRREIQYALVVKKPVLVARFEKDLPPPIHIINNTWVDFHAGWDGALLQLAGYLRSRPDAIRHTPPSPHTADPFRPYVEWLYKRLVTLLDQAVIRLIDLRAEDSPDAVERPRPRRDVFDQRFLPTLPKAAPPAGEPEAFTRFEQAFDHYRGRLLLLGEPGAGKSVTLMAHAREAAARRLSDSLAPLPIYGVIATWDARAQTPLAIWLASSHDDLDAKVLWREIEDGQTLLLLDGLDELGREWITEKENPSTGAMEIVEIFDPRTRFLRVIPSNNRVVVSCRILDYAEIGQKAPLNGGVILQPLNDAQLQVYLEKQPDLLAAVKADPDLKGMLTTPLILSLFAFAYRDMTSKDAIQLRDLAHSPGDLRDAIIGRYVRERYTWEDQKHGPLAFSLEEIYEVLGKVAVRNVISSRENVLESQDFRLDSTRHLSDFISLMVQLNLLALGSKEKSEKTWRFIHLLLRSYFALPMALTYLHHANKHVRSTAISALGQLDDARTVEPLIQALRDVDADIRHRAADILGQLGDARAVEPLLQILHDADRYVRCRAAFVLGRLGDTRAVESLLQTLHDADVGVRFSTIESLRKLGDARAVEPLIRALRDDNVLVRSSAAEALGQLGDMRATEPLMQALRNDVDRYVRRRAVEALGQLGDVHAIESLVQALHDVNTDVRRSVISALGKMDDIDTVQPLILALSDPDKGIRWRAAEALGQLGDTRAVEPLIQALRDPADLVRERAASALQRMGTPEARAAVAAYRRGEIKPRSNIPPPRKF